MTLRRQGRLALAAAVLLATVQLGLAAPAQAVPAQCPFTNTVCLFDGTGYTGARLPVSAPFGSTCVSLADHGWADRARSVLNTGARSAALFAADGCVGGPLQVAGNSGISNLGSFRARSVWLP